MPTGKSDLLQGTLNMLILKIVTLGPVNGYGIAQRIRKISKEVLQVQGGTLYPALRRLEKLGWLEAKPGVSEYGRQIKFYSLSAKGRKQLAAEKSNWNRLAKAVAVILKTASSQGSLVGSTKEAPTAPIAVGEPSPTPQSLEPPKI